MASDGQVFAILQKQMKSSAQARLDFIAAKRDDLKESEEAQIAVLQEYLDSVILPTDDAIENAVVEVLRNLKQEGGKINMSTVIARLLSKGGPLSGSPVSMSTVTRIIKAALPVQPQI